MSAKGTAEMAGDALVMLTHKDGITTMNAAGAGLAPNVVVVPANYSAVTLIWDGDDIEVRQSGQTVRLPAVYFWRAIDQLREEGTADREDAEYG
jgi:hypothetical protein